MKRLLQAILVFLLLFPINAIANTYYISNQTDPSEDGTIEHPFDSFADWQSIAADGDIVYLLSGATWNELLTITEPNCTISSYSSGPKPIIDAQGIRDYAILVSTANNTTIDGIDAKSGASISYGTIRIDGSINVTLRNGSAYNGLGSGIYTSGAPFSTGFTVDNYDVYNNAYTGIHHVGNVTGAEIKNSRIYNNGLATNNPSWSSGVLGSYPQGSIHDCIIYNNGNEGSYEHGIYITGAAGQSSPTNIYNNTIYGHLVGYGIVVKSVPTVNIYNNMVYANAYGLGILDSTNNAVTANIIGNVIYDNGVDNSSGITEMTQTLGKSINILNNTMFGRLTVLTNLNSLVVKNNIIYNTGQLISMNLQSNMNFDYNVLYSTGNLIYYDSAIRTFQYWQTTLLQDQNSINSDPLFVSTTDFRLQVTSPAIDAGVGVGLTTDITGAKVPYGTAPDIGAYEYIKHKKRFWWWRW